MFLWSTDLLSELSRREKEAKIKPDQDIDVFMKVRKMKSNFLQSEKSYSRSRHIWSYWIKTSELFDLDPMTSNVRLSECRLFPIADNLNMRKKLLSMQPRHFRLNLCWCLTPRHNYIQLFLIFQIIGVSVW